MSHTGKKWQPVMRRRIAENIVCFVMMQSDNVIGYPVAERVTIAQDITKENKNERTQQTYFIYYGSG